MSFILVFIFGAALTSQQEPGSYRGDEMSVPLGEEMGVDPRAKIGTVFKWLFKTINFLRLKYQ